MASAGIPARAMASFAVATPSSEGGVSLSAPPKVPTAVRTAETMKTSVMSLRSSVMEAFGRGGRQQVAARRRLVEPGADPGQLVFEEPARGGALAAVERRVVRAQAGHVEPQP